MFRLQHIKTIGYLTVISGFYFVSSVNGGTIVGSAHDFSQQGWNPTDEICIVCHTPHNSNTVVTEAPLWNHYVDDTTEYTPYFTVTLDAAVGQPTGISLLCLSCHDGTVAIDSFGATANGDFIDDGTHDIAQRVNLGTDLTNDHPISFVYDATLAADDEGLFDPATTLVTIGSDKEKTGFIADILLFDGVLQCASCHDVHNTFTDGDLFLLKISNTSSGLCLTCHDK